MASGFSSNTLAKKLGINEGFRVFLWNQPLNYLILLSKLPPGVSFVAEPKEVDLAQAFVTQKSELVQIFPQLKEAIKPDGSLWISWPKISSRSDGDLNENIVREVGLKNGLVDVKVIFVDNVWSGLKFVYRLKDR